MIINGKDVQGVPAEAEAYINELEQRVFAFDKKVATDVTEAEANLAKFVHSKVHWLYKEAGEAVQDVHAFLVKVFEGAPEHTQPIVPEPVAPASIEPEAAAPAVAVGEAADPASPNAQTESAPVAASTIGAEPVADAAPQDASAPSAPPAEDAPVVAASAPATAPEVVAVGVPAQEPPVASPAAPTT